MIETRLVVGGKVQEDTHVTKASSATIRINKAGNANIQIQFGAGGASSQFVRRADLLELVEVFAQIAMALPSRGGFDDAIEDDIVNNAPIRDPHEGVRAGGGGVFIIGEDEFDR
jgi:hypothetical protein